MEIGLGACLWRVILAVSAGVGRPFPGSEIQTEHRTSRLAGDPGPSIGLLARQEIPD